MSTDRVNVSVLRDHIHLMNLLFRWDAPTNTWVAQPNVFFNTPNIAADMGNFVGALNDGEVKQYPPNAPPPATVDYCPLYPQPTLRLFIKWGDTPLPPPDWATDQMGFFNDNIFVAYFTVPATFTRAFQQAGSVNFCEFRGPPIARQMTISESPCDFNLKPYSVSMGNQPAIPFNVVSNPGGLVLVPGHTYYVSVRNWSIDTGGVSAPPGLNAAGGFSVSWPHDVGQPTPLG